MAVGSNAERGDGATAAGTVLATLAAGQFLMTLDSSVMNVSIATVAKDVGTTVTGIQTAITLYTLVMASLMITGGKIGQIVGRKRAFAIGCVIYGCGSFITAISPNLAVLIFGWSFLEGIGAALILPAIVALVASNFGRERTAAGLRARGVGRRHRRRRRPADRRPLHHLPVVALGVRRRGARRRSRSSLLTRRMADTPAEHGVRLDLVGHRAVGARPRADRVRHPARGQVGLRPAQAEPPSGSGCRRSIWLMLGGGVVLVALPGLGEPPARARASRARRPGDPRGTPRCAAASPSFFFQYLLQAGLFFAVPLFLSVALGLSAVATACGSCRCRSRCCWPPPASPSCSRRLAAPGRPARVPGAVRRDRRDGRRPRGRRRARDRDLADAARRPRRRGAGLPARRRHRVVGARRAEQRGRRPPEHGHQPRRLDRHRPGRGGADLDADHLVPHRHRGEPRRPRRGLAPQAQVELSAGVPFVSDADLETALDEAGVPAETADAIVDENADGPHSTACGPRCRSSRSSPCSRCSSPAASRPRNGRRQAAPRGR